ncbi:hydroxymethylbilane synthase [Enterococcus sp. JM4C]|uniref:hydroxymethylbilane synthase n=1 Tax=Candidatus Enterococcus huntleyi TaxID=1857217 RepID=UPI00137A7C75|nr:hydroxymethylbilane synthase [Enterococcus sp. JM4C]KAF1299267.1 hydroxymethylbilane synthase [Enterococcus sp. JM4C]
MRTLKVGSRKSALAMKQTQLVVDAIKENHPECSFEIIGISTKGDRLQQVPLAQIGGSGVFVKEVEHQLQEGLIDFAVHSLKDMPAILPDDLMLAATPKRATPFDCLILQDKESLAQEEPLLIGTSSVRRAKQLAEAYPQMTFTPIRGKIETRIQKMTTENLDGTVLACAGLERLDYFDRLPAYKVLTPEVCVPAVGQGILGVECRKEDTELIQLLAGITHQETHEAAQAERQFLRRMDGNCEIPLGGYAEKSGDEWIFHAYLAKDRSAEGRYLRLVGANAFELANQAADELL